MLGITHYSAALPEELVTITVIISLCLFISNLFVVLTFWRMKKLDIKHLYMLALVVPDVVMLALNWTISAIIINGRVSITNDQCKILAIIGTSAISITAMLHSAMCVDRWMSVYFPIRYRAFKVKSHSRTITKLVCATCYFMPIILITISCYADLLEASFNPHVPTCVFTTGDSGIVGIALCSGIFVILPIFIQAITNVYILRRVFRLRGATRARVLRSVRTVLITVITYYVCWIPSASWLTLDMMLTNIEPSAWFSFACFQLLIANSSASLPIYILTIPCFKSEYISLMRQLWKCLRNRDTRISPDDRQ